MKTKSLLLVSALSLLPLTSMGADAPKAPNPSPYGCCFVTEGSTKAPAPPQLNHSTVSSSAPGTSQVKTGYFPAESNPSSKGVGGSGGAGGVGNTVDTAVGNAVYSAGDLKAPSAPK
jgi:hypothetical protein